MSEYDGELRRISADIDAKMAAGKYGVEQYDDMKRLEAAMEAALERIARDARADVGRLDALQKKLTDMEAARFADRCELELDLERWDGIRAAQVGRELEDVADRIMEAIEANRRGEDIDGALFEIHVDVWDILADLGTLDPENKEA